MPFVDSHVLAEMAYRLVKGTVEYDRYGIHMCYIPFFPTKNQ